MDKRIKISRKGQGEERVYTGKVQVRLFYKFWLTIAKVQDSCRWYVRHRCKEIISYLEGEEYKPVIKPQL
jgi:hypothetical protein